VLPYINGRCRFLAKRFERPVVGHGHAAGLNRSLHAQGSAMPPNIALIIRKRRGSGGEWMRAFGVPTRKAPRPWRMGADALLINSAIALAADPAADG